MVHSAMVRSQYGERREPVSEAFSEAALLSFLLGTSGETNGSSRKRTFAGGGEGSGDANGEGRGVSCRDFGTSGNRASLSANFLVSCIEILRGISKIFPSSTQKSRRQSLSLPLAVGFHELEVLWPEREVPDCV